MSENKMLLTLYMKTYLQLAALNPNITSAAVNSNGQ
jgi:hypothetical protein